MRFLPTILLLEAVAEHQAVVNTDGALTGEPAIAGEEERFQGIAEYGGSAGANIKLLTAGEVPFIAGEALTPADNGKPLKLGAGARLFLAEADDAYIARYKPKADQNTAGTLAAGEHGWCFIEKGVA